MGRKYSIDGSQDVDASTDTVLGLTSATTIRPKIYYILFGSLAAPVDIALQYLVQRYTAPGTATAVVPQALDPADPAASASAGENHTVEPTYTADAINLNFPANQKNSPQWHAREGGEIVLPATANNGVGIQPVHASFSDDVTCTMHYEE